MSRTRISISSLPIHIPSDQSLHAYIPIPSFIPDPVPSSIVVRRSIAKQAIPRTPRNSSSSSCSSVSSVLSCCFLEFPQDPVLKLKPLKPSPCNALKFQELGFHCNGEFPWKDETLGSPVLENQVDFGGFCPKGYAGVAEIEAVSSTDAEEEALLVDKFGELLRDMSKGHGKASGRQWMLRRMRNVGGVGSKKCRELRRRQVRMETEAWKQAVEEYRELLDDMCEKKLAPNLPYMKSLFLDWFEPLRDKIAAEQELIRQNKCRAPYAPYFDMLPADMMSVITMHKLTGMLMTGGEHGSTKVVQAACALGETIEHEVLIYKFLKKTKKKKTDICSKGQGVSNSDDQVRLIKKVTDLMKKRQLQAVRHVVKAQNDSKPWASDARAKVGSRLIELLIQTAYIQPPADQAAEGPPDVRPAFIHIIRTVVTGRTNRRCGVITCDPLVRKGLQETGRHMVIPYMPMLVPPVKWTGYDKGAHLFLPSYVMRTHGCKQQRDVIRTTPRKQLELVFEALDALGKTRWRVNRRVLSVIDRIWASGGKLAGLVDHTDVPVPEKPETEDDTELRKWRWKLRSVEKKNRELHSQRCDVELKLAVARKMRDEEGFFYPHNLDFRGRAYPMHPYLNHLGSDLCRGILEFAKGRPLGISGLNWLKIHLANLFAGGVDKLSHEGRLAFTENHLDYIFDSADKPLEGTRWWLNAEDPFQCLAVCIELAAALRSPSAESFISHIPVHQDGSCNGLQHYAALGRYKLGAAAVNLIKEEKPSDVYSGIASRVIDIMQRDAQKDPTTFSDAVHARQLIHQVDRKLVKQTVMTSVYGVTYIGARDQIERRLKERGAITDGSELFSASCYAAKITLTALGEMFEAERSIMSWLGDCAKIIAAENEPVRWTTPLGLPVVQPYYKYGSRLIRTSLQVLTLQRETEKVMIKRQRTAFPPNFVHSLDGSHMMMTAVACKRAGLNFAGVHDSYWTHACDVETMNKILREKFVELYEQPILENLLESFQKSFPRLCFPPLPLRGDFDLRDVLESPYFFN